MKTLLFAAFLLVTGLCSCNSDSDTPKAAKEKVAVADTTSNTLVSLSSSNTMTALLCQNWENKEDIDDDVLSGGESDLQIPFRSYCFFADGTVVLSPRDLIKFGKWKLDEKAKHLSITLEDGTKKDWQLSAIGVKSLLLKTDKPKPEKYVADGKSHSVLTDDPFYIANNKWRIKPTHSEADADIKKRVIDCVLFYSKFFKDNADHGFSTISFYGLPGCFKWYGGGISIINKEKISQKWIDCFYNKDQAVQAQQLLENVIGKKYKWDKTQPKWVRQSADVLLQMADSLK